MTGPTFRYTSYAGFEQAVSRTQENFDPYTRTQLIPIGTSVVVLNGIQENMRYDVDGIAPLLMTAPAGEVDPAFGGPGTGGIYGEFYKWRIRYKNSITGEVSGLSPLPEFGYNLGKDVNSQGDWIGASAIFEFGNVDVPGVDTIMLYRNSTSQTSIFFLIAELDNPTAGSTVTFTDDYNDEDIVTNDTDGLYVNPQNAQGGPVACARGHHHSSNRLFLYGLEPRNVYGCGTVDLTTDSDLVIATTGTACVFESGMIGCRFRPIHPTFGIDILDDTLYRIVEVVDQGTIRVVPPLKDNLTTVGGLSTVNFEIIDDRPAMSFWISEPGKPWSYDPVAVLSPANSASDAIRFLGAFLSRMFIITTEKIYAIQDDATVSPKDTIRFTEVGSEGTWGLWSSTVTPYGIVFVNDLGVRIYQGQGAPSALGADEFGEFPTTLLEGVDPAFQRYTQVYYNPKTRLIHVSYVPLNQTRFTEEIVFDTATGTWRGPWEREISAAGLMKNDDGSSVFVTGGLWGDLGEDGEQDLDSINPTTHVISGNVSLVYNTEPRFIGVQSDVDVEGDSRVLGCKFYMEDATGANKFYSTVAGVINATTLVLADYYDPAVNWSTYSIGAIQWDLKTAYLDGGEPIQPKTLEYVRLRFDRGDASEPFEVISISEDDGTEVVDEGGDVDPNASIYRLARPTAGGRAFQLQLRGTAESGLPRITQVVVDMTMGEGA